MAFRFELVSSAGDSLGSIETSETNWQAGDTLIGRVISVIPLARIAEYVDDPLNAVLEVERIE